MNTSTSNPRTEDPFTPLNQHLLFSRLHQTLAGVPGIDYVVPAEHTSAHLDENASSWSVVFDIEPTKHGRRSLTILAKLLDQLIDSTNAAAGNDACHAKLYVGELFQIDIWTQGEDALPILSVLPPDRVAEFITANFDLVVAQDDHEYGAWTAMRNAIFEDAVQRFRSPTLAFVPGDLALELVDPHVGIVAVKHNGRRLALYRFHDVPPGFDFKFLEAV